MRYLVRVAIGLLLGALVAVPLAMFVHVLWWAAGFGALAAAVGFLGSFFLWTADRPASGDDPGYEQVLFDRPNTLVSLGLVLVLAGSVVGYGVVAASSLSPEVEAALAQVEADQARLDALAAAYGKASTEHAEGKRPGADISSDLVVVRIDARKLAADVKAYEHPAELAALDAALAKGADAMASAIDALNKCVMGDEAMCVEARVAYADAARTGQALADERAALGLS